MGEEMDCWTFGRPREPVDLNETEHKFMSCCWSLLTLFRLTSKASQQSEAFHSVFWLPLTRKKASFKFLRWASRESSRNERYLMICMRNYFFVSVNESCGHARHEGTFNFVIAYTTAAHPMYNMVSSTHSRAESWRIQYVRERRQGIYTARRRQHRPRETVPFLRIQSDD